ncbi:MAG: hypothetical protein ACRDXB_08295 [Actinomycetes bacterium]
MTTIYPETGESLRELARRMLADLPPAVAARVQVATGGERAGLVVPEHAAPAPQPQPRKAPSPSRRAQRRRSKESST